MLSRPLARRVPTVLIAAVALPLISVALSTAPASATAARCTVSGPLTGFTSPQPVTSSVPNFVTMQAVSTNGIYAGVGYGRPTNADPLAAPVQATLVTWQNGRTKQLWRRVMFSGQIDNMLNAVAVSPGGTVLAKAERLSGGIPGVATYDGYLVSNHGVVTKLPALAGWQSVEPTGMSAKGVIVGQAYNARTRTFQVVTWTGAKHTPKSLTGSGYGNPVIDARGDVAYVDIRNGFGYAQLAGGGTVHLGGVNGEVGFNFESTAATTWHIFGRVTASTDSFVPPHAVQWTLPVRASGATVSVPAHPYSRVGYIAAAGSLGDVVGQQPARNLNPNVGRRILVTRTGKSYALPREYVTRLEPIGNTPVVVDSAGNVVFTGTDRLPHRMHCAL
jgi:hypothetical protein